MRECDIEAARTISEEMHKLALTTLHMFKCNHNNLHSECPNISRAARNIIRMYNAIHNAYWEVESLHNCYIAQFTDFDDDGEIIDTLPDFDESDAAILEAKATTYHEDAYRLLVRDILNFANFTGISADYFALLNEDNLRNFIDDFIIPAIITPNVIRSVVASANSFSTASPIFVEVKNAKYIHNHKTIAQVLGTL